MTRNQIQQSDEPLNSSYQRWNDMLSQSLTQYMSQKKPKLGGGLQLKYTQRKTQRITDRSRTHTNKNYKLYKRQMHNFYNLGHCIYV